MGLGRKKRGSPPTLPKFAFFSRGWPEAAERLRPHKCPPFSNEIETHTPRRFIFGVVRP